MSQAHPTSDGVTYDTESESLVILPANGQRPLSVGLNLDTEDDFAVELAGRDDEKEPYHLQVTHEGAPLDALTVAESFFSPGVGREQFVATSGRLIALSGLVAESDATSALTEALDEIHDQLVGGTLHVANQHVRDLIARTDDVTYTPEENTWAVTFDDIGSVPSEFRRTRSQATISAAEWADRTTVPSVPTIAADVFDGDDGVARWETSRAIWMQMATVGEAPPKHLPYTAEDLHTRGSIPGTDTDVDTFEAAVREHETLQDVRRTLSIGKAKTGIHEQAVRALGLSEELADVDE